jgi:hypothetical protein
MYLDADVLVCFRGLGRGHQWEINRTLWRVMEEEAKGREGGYLSRAQFMRIRLYVRWECSEANGRRIKYCLEHRCVRTLRVEATKERGLGDFWEAKPGLTRCAMGSRRCRRGKVETRGTIRHLRRQQGLLGLDRVTQDLPGPPDKAGSKHGQIRVIDESGEDYLCPERFFVPVKLPQAVEQAVRKATA